MLYYVFLLSEGAHNLPREEHDDHHRNRDNCVDYASSVQVRAAEHEMIGTEGLGDQRLQATIHAQNDAEREAPEQRLSKADSRHFCIVCKFSRINHIGEIVKLVKQARYYHRKTDF